MTVDPSGSVWAAGGTSSPDFMLTSNALQRSLTDSTFATGFFLKLSDNSPTGPPLSGGTQPPLASLVASPSLLRFVGTASQPLTSTVSVTSTGSSPLSFTVSSATASGGSWLLVTPLSGVTPAQLTVSAIASGLAPADYSGTINLTDSSGSVITLNVALQVPPGPPTITGATPAVVPLGAYSAVVTITGSGFNPSTQVMSLYMGYQFPASLTPVTYVDAKTIKVTLFGFLLWQPGTIQLEVANAAVGPWIPVTLTVR